MRILHVDYQQIRRFGKLHGNWVEKIAFGMIRNNHYLQSFSDRDVAAFEAPFGMRDLGWKKANKRALEMVEATEPDMIIIGHCDKITRHTLQEMRRIRPTSLMIHLNCDPLFVPANVANIRERATLCDAVYVTTGKRELKQFEGLGARIFHIPNPVDSSIEILDNSQQTDLPIDLMFCSNATKFTTRGMIVDHVRNAVKQEMNFRIFGSLGEPAVWGRDYDRVLAQTRMSLNLNRQEGNYWYASDRMAQLAGSGVLAFTSDKQSFDTLMPPETIPYFSDEEDLVKKIRAFHHDDAMRRHWASRARAFFHEEMNTTLYARFIVESAMGVPFSHDYVWARDVRPDGSVK